MKSITGSQFSEIKSSSGVVLLDVWTSTCSPCKALAPVLEKFASENKDIEVVKMEVTDEDQESYKVASDLRVSSVPALILFKNGIEVSRKVGMQSVASLTAWTSQVK